MQLETSYLPASNDSAKQLGLMAWTLSSTKQTTARRRRKPKELEDNTKSEPEHGRRKMNRDAKPKKHCQRVHSKEKHKISEVTSQDSRPRLRSKITWTNRPRMKRNTWEQNCSRSYNEAELRLKEETQRKSNPTQTGKLRQHMSYQSLAPQPKTSMKPWSKAKSNSKSTQKDRKQLVEAQSEEVKAQARMINEKRNEKSG